MGSCIAVDSYGIVWVVINMKLCGKLSVCSLYVGKCVFDLKLMNVLKLSFLDCTIFSCLSLRVLLFISFFSVLSVLLIISTNSYITSSLCLYFRQFFTCQPPINNN